MDPEIQSLQALLELVNREGGRQHDPERCRACGSLYNETCEICRMADKAFARAEHGERCGCNGPHLLN